MSCCQWKGGVTFTPPRPALKWGNQVLQMVTAKANEDMTEGKAPHLAAVIQGDEWQNVLAKLQPNQPERCGRGRAKSLPYGTSYAQQTLKTCTLRLTLPWGDYHDVTTIHQNR